MALRTFTGVKKSERRKLKCLWEESRLSVYSLRDRALLNEKSELVTSRGLSLKVALEMDFTEFEHVMESGQSISCPPKQPKECYLVGTFV